MANLTGWWLNGEFISCDPYSHCAAILSNEKFRPLIPKWDEYEDRIDDARNSCQALEDSDDHPEWHHYEMTCDDVGWQLRADLYEAGAFRVATRRQRSEINWSSDPINPSYENVMYFEGTAEWLAARERDLVCFAGLAGYTKVALEPVNIAALRR